jgi:hypothetical protein
VREERLQEVRDRKEEAERKEKGMTIEEKREYIKRAFRDYVNNKRRLEMLNIPGLGGVDYSRPSVVSDHSNGTEKTVLRYIDKKDTLEKQVEIVKRTIEHYKIEDKKHGGEGKASYIYNRWLRRLSFRKAAIQSHIAESTSAYWTEEIFFTAEIIAEEYQLF